MRIKAPGLVGQGPDQLRAANGLVRRCEQQGQKCALGLGQSENLAAGGPQVPTAGFQLPCRRSFSGGRSFQHLCRFTRQAPTQAVQLGGQQLHLRPMGQASIGTRPQAFSHPLRGCRIHQQHHAQVIPATQVSDGSGQVLVHQGRIDQHHVARDDGQLPVQRRDVVHRMYLCAIALQWQHHIQASHDPYAQRRQCQRQSITRRCRCVFHQLRYHTISPL
ncbi:hypothetical protein D3C81_1584480 [compost metagenome]